MQEKTNLKAFENSWYNPGATRIKRALWYLVNAIFIKSWIPGSGWRIAALRIFGATIGRGVVIKPYVNIKYPWKLHIGDHTWIGENVWIDSLDSVTIAANCCISQGAMLLCGNHNYKKPSFDLILGSITLEEGVWIGAKCLVTPGVHVASHAVLAAGSVATKNLESYSIYSGAPAVKIRDREMSA